MAQNSVDLSNLPTKFGKIDWQKCDNNIVSFVYRDISDYLIVIKHVDCDLVLINFHNEIMNFSKEQIKHCVFGKLFNFGTKGNYKFNVGDVIPRPNGGTFTILEQIRDAKGQTKLHAKAYVAICSKCRCTFTMREGNIDKGYNCPVCRGRQVGRGFNDLWTVDPEISAWLTNPEDGYLYTVGSNKFVEFTCINCHTNLGKKQICTIYDEGVSCPVCGKGKSYPNKFMFNLLTQLQCDFDNEVKFDWCVFEINGKSTFGIYDFVIRSKKLIIEMDGGLGHGKFVIKGENPELKREETLQRDRIKDQLAAEHDYKVIRIDCAYYTGSGTKHRFDYCKNAVMNSELNSFFDLSHVDYEAVDEMCNMHLIETAKNLYQQGYSWDDIKHMLRINNEFIQKYINI